jgi:hypothetical protein
MFSSLLWITSISSRLSISAILALTPFSLYTGYNWYTSGFL